MCTESARQIRSRTFRSRQKIRYVDYYIYFQCWTDVRRSSIADWKFVNFFGVDSKMTWTGSPVWESFGPMHSRLLNFLLQFPLQVEQCSVLKLRSMEVSLEALLFFSTLLRHFESSENWEALKYCFLAPVWNVIGKLCLSALHCWTTTWFTVRELSSIINNFRRVYVFYFDYLRQGNVGSLLRKFGLHWTLVFE